MLIRYWRLLNVYTKVPLIVGVFLESMVWPSILLMGNVLSCKGNKVLKSWSKKTWEVSRENKIMTKLIRSCKPLVLCYGYQFVIDKASLFVFYRGVMRGTVRSLLATIK